MFCVRPYPQGASAEGLSAAMKPYNKCFTATVLKIQHNQADYIKMLHKERPGCLLGPYPLAGYYRPVVIYWTDKALKYVRGVLMLNLAQQEEQLKRSGHVVIGRAAH